MRLKIQSVWRKCLIFATHCVSLYRWVSDELHSGRVRCQGPLRISPKFRFRILLIRKDLPFYYVNNHPFGNHLTASLFQPMDINDKYSFKMETIHIQTTKLNYLGLLNRRMYCAYKMDVQKKFIMMRIRCIMEQVNLRTAIVLWNGLCDKHHTWLNLVMTIFNLVSFVKSCYSNCNFFFLQFWVWQIF